MSTCQYILSKLVGGRYILYLVEVVCTSVGHKIGTKGRRSPNSILKDIDSRMIMKKWLLQATKVLPPMKASDFAGFVKDHFKYTINETNARLWMKELGFSFGNNAALSIYHEELYDDGVDVNAEVY